jgi:hypothetical protein
MPYKDPEKKREWSQRYEKKRVKLPGFKEYHRKYRKCPKHQKYIKDYLNRPEVKRRKIQRQKEPIVRRQRLLRNKLRLSVIHQYRYISTIHKLIGCDVPTARAHLEAQFEPWMTWENYGSGKGKWTIDHIIRVASIDIFDEDEVKRIFHYTNMRPLCFIKNCEDTDEGRGLKK